jgi:hypothetical protein
MLVGMSIGAVAGVGTLCALAVHHGCFNTAPPVSVPDPGTPRAHYCSLVHAQESWIAMVLIPVVLAGVVGAIKGAGRLLAVLTFAVCVVLLANAILASSLTSALTI